MRLSRPDTNDPSKRRHFEISIDSPFHILSCLATQANIALPAYSNSDGQVAGDIGSNECGCPGAARRPEPITSYLHPLEHPLASSMSSEEPAPPPMAHLDASHNGAVQRPIHLLRGPSFNPPAFDAEDPPPPMITPPPDYDTVVGAGEGLADYFARLADEVGEDSDEDQRGRGRIDVPLTPGGRLNRSMDERRTWAPLGHAA